MQSMKETTANIAASAKAGMEKTKAAAKEKVDKMSSHDPVQKEMAAEKKEERMARAELNKREAREHNAAAREAAKVGGRAEYTTRPYYMTEGGHTYSASGQPGYPTGTHQMSAMPGHGTGAPHGGKVEEGVAQAHPSGLPGGVEGYSATGAGPNVAGYGLEARGERPAYGAGTRADEPGYNAPPGRTYGI